MTVRSAYRLRASRRWGVATLVAACVALGALVGLLVIPQYVSNAGNTAVSTLYKTATNTVNGSVAASLDAPGGTKTGTAKPGDTIKWAVSYQNNTSAAATVDLKDVIANAGTYVNGSLQLPQPQRRRFAVSAVHDEWRHELGQRHSPADANGLGFTGTMVPQGTQQRSLNFPSPASAVLSTTGGDGYNVAMRNGLVYAVFHHTSGSYVYCAQQNGSVCPGWSANNLTWSSTSGTALGTGTAYPGVTAWQNGTWISGTKMFFFVGAAQAPIGTGCVDLSTTPAKSCGFVQFDIGYDANGSVGAQIGSSGIPAANGNIYAVAETTTGAKLFCVAPTTGTECGTLVLNTGAPVPDRAMNSFTYGNYVFASVPVAGGSWLTYCYVAGGSLCSGSWPITTSGVTAVGGPALAPILSTTGAVQGVCTIPNSGASLDTTNCWNLTGARTTQTPYNGTYANFSASGAGAGDAFVVGTKVYLASSSFVACVDFATYTGTGRAPECSGFTRPANQTNYTVRSASQIAPNCLVADGDGGKITFFNALTGGGCIGVSGPQTMTVSPLASYCGSGTAGFKGWGALTLPGLTAGTYTNATVTLKDQNGNVITGFNGVTLAAGGSLNLSAIPTSVTSISATVVVNGVNDPTGVVNGQIAITWQGDPPQMCFQTIAPPVACDADAPTTLSNTAKAVTTSTAGNDAPNGNNTYPVQFTVRADPSQCSLSIKKTSGVQNVRPGDTVTYTITVKNTGTQAYNSTEFSDDLTDVLKESVYNGDHAATVGTASYSAPTLSWTGGLAAGATATITYSVTVNSPDAGDHTLLNTVVSPTKGNNCPVGSTDPACTSTVVVQVIDALWNKIDATPSKNVLSGAAWTFTPVDGSGKPTGPAITVTDCTAASASLCTGADIDPIAGQFRLTNLGPGTYQLVETQAPVGFKLNPTPIPVTLTSALNTVRLPDVVNKQLPVPDIPLTGGLGTDALTITGGSLLAAMLGLAVWQLIRRRRIA
ncbi:SpaA isopeptide-forming pilin-related protein [Leifsonia xyli]|uniref:DUF7927 domain-containing protein n=1 Tax=Leifsonia xyli TaxID=1575 RepID=UPI003D66BEB8